VSKVTSLLRPPCYACYAYYAYYLYACYLRSVTVTYSSTRTLHCGLVAVTYVPVSTYCDPETCYVTVAT
jgi:hypothetical protein